MTEFEAVITSYKQANAQYIVLKCVNGQKILTPYIDYTMVMTFYEDGVTADIKLEHIPLNEIVTKLTNIGWKVCA